VRLDRTTLVKVPEITLYFWIVKILTTGMGETTSDFFVHRVGLRNTLGLVIVVVVAGVVLVALLLLQFAQDRYVTTVYWMAVLMVSIFGTMAADGVHVVLHVPYIVSTIAFSTVLALFFAAWFATEGTLSIHSIFTTRRELFYWAVVMTTFALGTAAGDMTAFTLGWGFFASTLLFGTMFAIPLLARRWLGAGEVLTFWFAYVVTRPLGASFADLFAAPKSLGGLGLGYGSVSVVLGLLIVGFVAHLARTGEDVSRADRTGVVVS
jgi:uncharacterized membrane-anchored protein